MPVLGELGALPNVLSNSLISHSPLWKREASSLKQLDLITFLHKYKRTPQYGQACREVREVVNAGAEALIEGEIQEAEFVYFEFPKVVFTSEELIEWLSTVSIARQNALLFALEMNMDPKEVIGLEWKDLKRLNMTQVAAEIVNALPRHLNLKYVFWDFLSNGAAAPLFGLTESALDVSQGLGFDVLMNLYNTMVIVDTERDYQDFMSQLGSEFVDRQ